MEIKALLIAGLPLIAIGWAMLKVRTGKPPRMPPDNRPLDRAFRITSS